MDEERNPKDESEQEEREVEELEASQEDRANMGPSIGSIGAILSERSAMNSVIPAVHNAEIISSSLSSAIKPILDAKPWTINVPPLITPSLQNCFQNISKSVDASYSPMSEAMKSLTSLLQGTLSNYSVQWPEITSPVFELFKNFPQNPFHGLMESIKGFDFSLHRTRLYHLLLCETFDAKWTPNAVWDADPELLKEVLSIVRSTKKSKSRVKKIDKAILDYYTKTRVESIKKNWRKKGFPEYSTRMMHQAVQAYHRKEYAITVVVLSTMWEGIIYEKAHDTRGKNGKRTKNNFEKLIEQNDFDELFQSFFDEYIMYDCRSTEQVIEDVPGRNSSAHSWYNKYPSKKAALNAILFTDFLLKLEPISNEDKLEANSNGEF